MAAFVIPRRRKPSWKNGFARSYRTALYTALRKRLIGAWVPPLGRTGGMLRDVSGNRKHGALTNMNPATDWTVGRLGYQLDFDGVDDHVDLGTDYNELNGLKSLTVEFWANFDDATFSGWDGIIGLGANGKRLLWIFGTESGDTVIFHLGTTVNSTSSPDLNMVSNSISVNQFKQYVMTWDGVNGFLYENTTQTASDTTAGDTIESLTTEPRLFGHIDTFAYLDGQLGPVRFWNRVLTAPERRLLYRDHLATLRLRDEIAFYNSGGGGGDWPSRSPIHDIDSGFTPGGIQPIDSGIAT